MEVTRLNQFVPLKKVGTSITPKVAGDTLDAVPIGSITPAVGSFTQLKSSKGVDVASANALTLGADGNYFDITGTTAITSIGTLGIGIVVTLHFDGILILTHNGTDLVLPSAANITTAAGDEATFIEYATGDWRCINYLRADGTAIISSDTFGVSWDELADTYIRTGRIAGFPTSQSLSDSLLPIQAAVRRCILQNNGVVAYYLNPDDSYNRVGFTPDIIGTDDAGAANKVSDAVLVAGTDDVGTALKVSDVGVFTAAESEYVGKYVHNTTDDTYALITAKDSNDVLSINVDIMDITETFNIGVLSAPAASYVGHYVHNTTDDTYSIITAKDSDAALSIKRDVMANGEAFEICTAVLNGTDGQVMVQIPAFYYRYTYSGAIHTWEISQTPQSGFSLHPAFFKNGEFVPYRYIGAYEGSMYDAGTTAMIPDADIEVAVVIAAGDLLCSISGQYPKVNETRVDFRTLASQRGTGWRNQDYDLISATQLLYLIEYADFDSQSMIGNGRTMFNTGTWEAANQGNGKYIGECGYSNGDGNASGGHSRASAVSIAAINTDTDVTYHDYMTYRGIENFFGNVWKWVDGINVNSNVPYVSNVDTDFADDTITDYTDLGITLVNTNGYQNTLKQQDRGFLPASIGASSSTKITDYYYQNTGWRVVLLGGVATIALNAGAFGVSAHDASSAAGVSVGGRLAF